MRKKSISFSLTGFAYDPEQPTLNLERLAFAELQILDGLQAEGFEFRQVLPEDVQLVRGKYQEWVESVEVGEEYDLRFSDADADELLSCSVPFVIGSEANQGSRDIQNKELVKYEIGQIRETLEALKTRIEILMAQERILQLSDGTKILYKSGVIDT